MSSMSSSMPSSMSSSSAADKVEPAVADKVEPAAAEELSSCGATNLALDALRSVAVDPFDDKLRETLESWTSFLLISRDYVSMGSPEVARMDNTVNIYDYVSELNLETEDEYTDNIEQLQHTVEELEQLIQLPVPGGHHVQLEEESPPVPTDHRIQLEEEVLPVRAGHYVQLEEEPQLPNNHEGDILDDLSLDFHLLEEISAYDISDNNTYVPESTDRRKSPVIVTDALPEHDEHVRMETDHQIDNSTYVPEFTDRDDAPMDIIGGFPEHSVPVREETDYHTRETEVHPRVENTELLEDNMSHSFVHVLYDTLQNGLNEDCIVWAGSGRSFKIEDKSILGNRIPLIFPGLKYSTFLRKLNSYGFQRIKSKPLEYCHPSFARGDPHTISSIEIVPHRRVNRPSIEEFQQLKSDVESLTLLCKNMENSLTTCQDVVKEATELTKDLRDIVSKLTGVTLGSEVQILGSSHSAPASTAN